jgi:hypothetical protein
MTQALSLAKRGKRSLETSRPFHGLFGRGLRQRLGIARFRMRRARRIAAAGFHRHTGNHAA